MKNKIRRTIISFVLLVSMLFVSCVSGTESTAEMLESMVKDNAQSVVAANTEEGISGTYSSTISGWITDEEAKEAVTPSSSQMPSTYSADDYVLNEDEYTDVEIDLATVYDGEKFENDNIKVTFTTTDDDSSTVVGIKIKNSSSNKYNYILSGSSSVGVKIINRSSDYCVTLNSVEITSAEDSDEQALKLDGDEDDDGVAPYYTCFLILNGESTLTGCSATDDTTTNAVKVCGSLVISGEGILNVYATNKNGIVSDDVVVINGGTVNVTLDPEKSDGTGIKSTNGYVQNGGEVNITGLNMTEGMENKGIKVEGDESETEYGRNKGYILINGGEINIKTSGKGMTASFDPDEDGDTSSSKNDPSADVFINNGLITITTTATPREDSSSTANDGVSPEGIEGKRSVTINGGKIVLNTTDDAINASVDGDCYIVINGGLVYAHSSANDAVDSNGTITINEGTLIALGASVPEGGIDCDEDSRFVYKGGTVIALGGTNNLPQGNGTSGYYLTTSAGMNMGGGMGEGGTAPSNGSNPPSIPSGDNTSTPPELPSNGTMAGESMMTPPTGGGTTPPEKPDGESGDAMGPQGGMTAPGNMGGTTALSSGDTLTLLKDDGTVILSFTLPDGVVSTSLLLASSSLEEGESYSISTSSSVKSAEYTFEGLSMGEVEVSVTSSTSLTLSSLGTTISL